MDRLKERTFAFPAARVRRDQSIIEHQPHVIHSCDDRQPAMGVLHRDRVVVVIKPDQRLRIRRAVVDTSSLERLLRQRQKRSLILFEEFFFRSSFPASSLRSIGDTTLFQGIVKQFPGADLGHRHEEVATSEPDQPLDIPFLVRTPHQAEMLLKEVVTLKP